MKPKNTDDLQQELMQASDLSAFLADNQDNFCSTGVPEILTDLLEKRNLSKAALARQSCTSEIYLHQIFSGRRNPTRNRLLCLCFGLSATLDEAQELLKLCGHAPLYPKIRRDSIIMFGLSHNSSLFEINDKLFENNEDTLF